MARRRIENRQARRNGRRVAASLVAAAAAAAAMAAVAGDSQAQNTTAVFTSTLSGKWSDPSRWSTHAPPNSGTVDAVISGFALVDNLFSVGSVTVNQGYEVAAGGGGLDVYGDLIDRGVFSVEHNVGSDGFVGFAASGDQHMSGTGAFRFSSTSGIFKGGGSGTLIIDPSLQISGSGGLFQANDGAGILNLATITLAGSQTDIFGSFTNGAGATIVMTDRGVLNLAGAWHNDGVINVGSSSANLGGTFRPADIGTFISESSASVRITGLLDNTAATFTWMTSRGSLSLMGGTIRGGAMLMADNSSFRVAPLPPGQVGVGTLDGVTLQSDLAFTGFGEQLQVSHDLTLRGTSVDLTGGLATGHASITLTDPTAQTLGGTGQVYFGAGGTAVGTAGASLMTKTNGLLTVGPGILLHGQRMYLTGILNQGTVSTDLPGGSISLTKFTNAASGNIFVGDGGTLTLGTGWQNNGTVVVRNGTIVVAGRFPASQLDGVIHEGSGTIFMPYSGAGVLDNANHVLVADATTPAWRIEGTIIGGTVAANAGGTMSIGNATFDGVHLAGRPSFTETFGLALAVVNDLTLESGATIDLSNAPTNSSTTLTLSIGQLNDLRPTSQTLGGFGDVRLGPKTAIQVQPFHTLTIGPGVMIHGTAGSLAGRFLNQGTILAEAASNAGLNLSGPAFTNAGSFRVESGATASVSVTTFTQTASGITTVDGLLNLFGAPHFGAGLLAGGGTVMVNPAGGTMAVGGTIAPGDTLTGSASDVLTINANLTLTGRLAPQPGATATSSLLDVNGNLDLSSTSDSLDLSALSGLAEGTSFAVAETSNAIIGVFDNVTPGFAVDYQPHEVVVTVVPEPRGAAAILLGAGLVPAFLRPRRRNRGASIGVSH
jgi:hypothetical protein